MPGSGPGKMPVSRDNTAMAPIHDDGTPVCRSANMSTHAAAGVSGVISSVTTGGHVPMKPCPLGCKVALVATTGLTLALGTVSVVSPMTAVMRNDRPSLSTTPKDLDRPLSITGSN